MTTNLIHHEKQLLLFEFFNFKYRIFFFFFFFFFRKICISLLEFCIKLQLSKETLSNIIN
jgi:hypothetical protein